MIRIFFLLTGLLLYFIQHFTQPVPLKLQVIALIAGVILLGVPHGAADLLVAAKNAAGKNRQFSSRAFHTKYLLRMMLFGCLLWLAPLAGYILFILFAAYHFGETDLNRYLTNSLFGKIYVTAYGLVILAVIFLTHLQELKPVSGTIEAGDYQTILINNIQRFSFFIVPAIISSFILLSAFYFHYNVIKLKSQALIIGQFSILLFILYNLPVIAGFTFYFVGWHSVLSLKYIGEYLQKDGLNTTKNIARQITFYSLLAIGGMLFFAGAGFVFFNNSSPTFYIFLGLAVLTAPHIHIMYDMYKNISCKRNQENNISVQPSLR